MKQESKLIGNVMLSGYVFAGIWTFNSSHLLVGCKKFTKRRVKQLLKIGKGKAKDSDFIYLFTVGKIGRLARVVIKFKDRYSNVRTLRTLTIPPQTFAKIRKWANK